FSAGPREFFTEVDYRDPEVMRTHGYHWFDKGRIQHEPHPSPIRKGPLLYNIFSTRTEGYATGWEEVMMQAGMFEFTMKAFMEEFDAAGLIPMSLIEWQVTGELPQDTKRMLATP
ncbi:MAG: hypothetical protein HYZ58_04100, partial [Acidobacteria bacterium]|nr:hypothetical protein [Acidobacteriota bacterium]